MKTYKRWFHTTIFLILLLIAGIMLFNYIIDPHNIFKTKTYSRFNVKKIELNEYLQQARAIVHQKPEVIFLGSSRVRIGLDPQYYELLTGEPAYNAGLSSSTPSIQLNYLKYALKNNPNVKTVVLGLDFAAFKENTKRHVHYDEERLQTKWYTFDDWTQQTLSISATKASLKVMYDNWFTTIKYTTDNYALDGRQKEEALLPIREQLLGNGENFYYVHLQSYIGEDGFYRNYKLSDEQMDDFKKIIALCKENEIELFLFINPAHAMQWEAIQLAGIWDEFEQWKQELVSLAPIWDFSGFHAVSITPPDRFDDYIDQSHYRKHIGNYIFQRMLHKNEEQVPLDFGVQLSEYNINEHLAVIRDQKANWEADNSDIIHRMQEMYPMEQ